MRRSTLAFIVLVACGLAVPAQAQLLDLPSRSSRGLFGGGPPPDPNRTQNDLTLHVNFLGGYDDNVAPYGSTSQIALTRPSGYTGLTDVQMIYDLGNHDRSFDANARGYMNAYRGVGMPPTYGGEMDMRAHTNVGRDDDLSGFFRASYDPYFALGAFNQPSGSGTVGVPTSNQNYALDESRSWAINADTSYSHALGDKKNLTGSYSYGQRKFDEGKMYDNLINAGQVRFGTPVAGRLSVDTSYRYSDERFTQHNDLVNRRTIVDQTIDGGARYDKDLSATRHVSLTGGAGALYVDGTDYVQKHTFAFWEPSGYGGAALDFNRSWSLSGQFRRALSVLQGVTPDPYIQNTSTVSLGGYLARRIEGVFEAAYANARAGYSASALGAGHFDTYSGTAQLRFQLTRSLSTAVIYNYYYYQLDQAAQESLHVASPVRRNAIRVGFTWQQLLMTSRSPAEKRAAGGRD